MTTLNVTQQTITPKMATKLLKLNTANRNLNQRHMLKLANDLKAGLWQTNGDTIRYNDDQLIDGQHRLAACVSANISFNTLVIDNVPTEVFNTIDTGKLRNGADTLKLSGAINTSQLAAGLYFINNYQNGDFSFRKGVSNSVLCELYEEHPKMVTSVDFIKRYQKDRMLRMSIATGLHYLFSKIDPAKADAFFAGVYRGMGMTEDSPIHKLREAFIRNTLSLAKRDKVYLIAITIKAWNLYIKDKPGVGCQYNPSSPFPLIQRKSLIKPN